jgi:hypothetical protein
MAKKPLPRKLTPSQCRVQDALRVIVAWEREILKEAELPWKAVRGNVFWGLLSYIEVGEDGGLPPEWFEKAEEAILHDYFVQGAEERVRIRMDKAALRGISILKGNKKPRKDELAKLAERTFTGLLKKNGRAPTTREVLASLPLYDGARGSLAGIIEEIDDALEIITWSDRRGRDRKTTFKKFGDRMTTIRKRGSK